MEKILGIVAVILLLAACGQHQTAANSQTGKTDTSFTIKGNINGVTKGLALLSYVVGKDVRIDSAVISNSGFSFTGKLPEPEEVQVSFMNDAYNGGITLFAENAVINIRADTASLDKPVIEGSQSQKELEDYKKQLSPVDTRSDQLNRQGRDIFTSGKLTKAVGDSLTSIGHTLDSQRAVIIAGFVKTNPGSPVSAWAISKNLLFEPKLETLEPLFNILPAARQTGIYGTVIHDAIASAKATGLGRPAIDFTQPDTAGKPISLSLFKGKYTLVDFWASWCGPCRAENPNIVKLYKQYNKKGFAILGVSLDTDKELWVKAIQKDQLTWAQVSDLKAWNNGASMVYGIKGIPFSVLLDKNGIIIAKNLRGAELEKKLKEIFK
jgi:thiol-disulfide isomerase/thioredoxin